MKYVKPNLFQRRGSGVACRLSLYYCAVWGLLTAEPSLASEEPSPAGIEFFENNIRPVLVKHCYKCHSEQTKSPKGGLRLDTRQGLRAGGESGQAVIPGDINESLLIGALRHEDYEMPPSGPLPDAVIADFERWVEMGAPDPRTSAQQVNTEIDLEEGRKFWAFQPPQSVQPPTVGDWPRSEIDQFILAGLDSAGLSPIDDADPLVWLRRVTFDLTGLPPTDDEVLSFARDHSNVARQRVVNRLLQTSAFGERWGRHWLDVVRYAESMGKTRNFPFTFAWRYRDYVIDSFNDDKPYDQFLIEQLAGDLLTADSDSQRDQQYVATGFLALGSLDLNERDAKKFAAERVSEQIDVTSRAVMATTIGCARCHDHKFDPIPTQDYYALAGIFFNTDVLNGYANKKKGRNDYRADQHLVKLSGAKGKPGQRLDANPPRKPKFTKQQVALNERMAELKAKAKRFRREQQKWLRKNRIDGEPNPVLPEGLQERMQRVRKQIAVVKRRLNRLAKGGRRGLPPPKGPLAMGVRDANRVSSCAIQIGGDPHNLGPVVERGFPQVMMSEFAPVDVEGSGRLELAQWLTQPDHPLTSRVMVNRVWHHLMGAGIVRTVDNFGVMGERPSHPELLDYLAIQFVQDGWSIKELIRNIVLSRTYGLSSASDSRGEEIDPDNRLRWRMSRRRLEAEAIRDSMLAVSGQLDSRRPKPFTSQSVAYWGNSASRCGARHR